MGRVEVLQGVREMRLEGLLERHERGELSQIEAAELLGVSERTLRRWRDRLQEEGAEGLRDRRIGKPSSRRAAVAEIVRMLGLYQERYEGFTVKHFHEQLVKRHHYKLGYTVTRLSLQSAGLVKPAPRRSAHRRSGRRRGSRSPWSGARRWPLRALETQAVDQDAVGTGSHPSFCRRGSAGWCGPSRLSTPSPAGAPAAAIFDGRPRCARRRSTTRSRRATGAPGLAPKPTNSQNLTKTQD
jgi:transposase